MDPVALSYSSEKMFCITSSASPLTGPSKNVTPPLLSLCYSVLELVECSFSHHLVFLFLFFLFHFLSINFLNLLVGIFHYSFSHYFKYSNISFFLLGLLILKTIH